MSNIIISNSNSLALSTEHLTDGEILGLVLSSLDHLASLIEMGAPDFLIKSAVEISNKWETVHEVRSNSFMIKIRKGEKL